MMTKKREAQINIILGNFQKLPVMEVKWQVSLPE